MVPIFQPIFQESPGLPTDSGSTTTDRLVRLASSQPRFQGPPFSHKRSVYATNHDFDSLSTQGAMKSPEFRNYPVLDREEFAEVCHQLDRRYLRATLGPVRQQWKLHVVTALDTSFAFDSEFTTYIQIVRPLQWDLDLEDGGLSAQLGKFSLDAVQHHHGGETEVVADQGMVDLEDADECALPLPPRPAEPPYVTYEIHLHPTYRVPCLWFSLRGLPADEPALDLETVFRRLVPDHFKEKLRNPGPIGGISVDYHPITGVPTFFIHPCLIGDAMASFDCSKEDYLMVWAGLVGSCVGLWVPKEMAVA